MMTASLLSAVEKLNTSADYEDLVSVVKQILNAPLDNPFTRNNILKARMKVLEFIEQQYQEAINTVVKLRQESNLSEKIFREYEDKILSSTLKEQLDPKFRERRRNSQHFGFIDTIVITSEDED